MRFCCVLPALHLAIVAFGCAGLDGRPVGPCGPDGRIRVSDIVDEVDLLLMVDNSSSMTEEQASLARVLPLMVGILSTGDFDQDGDFAGDGEVNDADFERVRDLHVGVITSDMGTGGFFVPTCSNSDFGDDGVLRTRGRTDVPGCMARYPSFLSFQPAAGGSAADFAHDVVCVATVGTGGCGFEQQLEAILKALSPSAPTTWTRADYAAPTFFGDTFGQGDTHNDGFVRDNSVLAIVAMTDEEDCSARDPDLFNPTSATYGATDLNLRCFAHSGPALHPISRFVDGLIRLRRRAGHLVYAPIVGIPEDLAPAPGESPDYGMLVSEDPAVRDVRMQERVDTAMPNRLLPSCNVPGRGVAFPPVRLVRVAERLDALGAGVTVQSICSESFAGALTEVIRLIKSALRAKCLPRPLDLQADGTVSCDVVALMPPDLTCADLPGGTPKLVEGEPVFEDGRSVCVVVQRVPADRSMNAPPLTELGWYYDTFTTAGRRSCEESPGAGWRRIAFTAQPPRGVEIRLECSESAQEPRDGDLEVGTFCHPTSGQTSDGLACSLPAGALNGIALECDPVQRACGVPCAADADCQTAEQVGFVCDGRTLGEVSPALFDGNTQRYGFCVNPACG